jgi:hypothetical protein
MVFFSRFFVSVAVRGSRTTFLRKSIVKTSTVFQEGNIEISDQSGSFGSGSSG